MNTYVGWMERTVIGIRQTDVKWIETRIKLVRTIKHGYFQLGDMAEYYVISYQLLIFNYQ